MNFFSLTVKCNVTIAYFQAFVQEASKKISTVAFQGALTRQNLAAKKQGDNSFLLKIKRILVRKRSLLNS